MNRREFLKLSGALALAFAAPDFDFPEDTQKHRVYYMGQEIKVKEWHLNVINTPHRLGEGEAIYFQPRKPQIEFVADGQEYKVETVKFRYLTEEKSLDILLM